MKKMLVMLVMLVSLVSMSFAGNYNVPNGYTLKESSNGAKIYSNGNISVVIADMDRNRVDLGILNYAYRGKFYKDSISNWWKNYASYSTFAMINGQFFNTTINPTTLSFPLKDNGHVVTSYVDDNSQKRTLIIDKYNNAKILRGYTSYYLYNDAPDVIVGLNPSVSKSSWAPIGRNYIGGIPKGTCNPRYSSCDMKYLMFFIAKRKTQYYMLKEVEKWGVSKYAVVMMDGSGSSQLKSRTSSMYGDGRYLPNVITINKW